MAANKVDTSTNSSPASLLFNIESYYYHKCMPGIIVVQFSEFTASDNRYVYIHLHCAILSEHVNEFKNQTYIDIQYHDQLTSCGSNYHKKSKSITNIHYSTWTHPKNNISFHTRWHSYQSSHLFNQVADDKPNDRIIFKSIIMYILCLARMSSTNLLLAAAYLTTKAQHPNEGDHKAKLRISYIKSIIRHCIKVTCKLLNLGLVK